jgi:hypothetical protein
VSIDREHQSTAPTCGTIVPDVVVGERRVVVPDEQAILIGEVFDPVLEVRIVQESKVVPPGPKRVIVVAIQRLVVKNVSARRDVSGCDDIFNETGREAS